MQKSGRIFHQKEWGMVNQENRELLIERKLNHEQQRQLAIIRGGQLPPSALSDELDNI